MYSNIGAPTQHKFIEAPAQTCAIAAIMIIALQICIYMCVYILIRAPARQIFIGAPPQTCVIAAIMIIAK